MQMIYDKLSVGKQLQATSKWINTLKPIAWVGLMVIWFIYSMFLYETMKQEKIEIGKQISQQLQQITDKLHNQK